MSFARFGWDGSDVYIFEHTSGFIQCCGCSLAKPSNPDDIFGMTDLKTPREALEHLEVHVKAGDYVPSDAFTKIKKEYKNLDAPIEPYVEDPEVTERIRARMRESFKND